MLHSSLAEKDSLVAEFCIKNKDLRPVVSFCLSSLNFTVNLWYGLNNDPQKKGKGVAFKRIM